MTTMKEARAEQQEVLAAQQKQMRMLEEIVTRMEQMNALFLSADAAQQKAFMQEQEQMVAAYDRNVVDVSEQVRHFTETVKALSKS